MAEDRNPEDTEPTDDEIKAAAAAEEADQQAAARAAKKTTAEARRGPGRPPGARNKSTAEKGARDAGRSPTKVVAPKTPPIDDSEAVRAAMKARAAARKKREAELLDTLKEMRPDIVKAVGMATGIPAEYLATEKETPDGKAVVNQDGDKLYDLTVYGEALAPSVSQLRWIARGYVRAEETDAGAKIAERLDQYAPWAMMLAGIGAVGFWGFSAMGQANAIKPMIAAEIARMGDEQNAQ